MEKLFNDAISHWERMIAWAEKQPKDEEACLVIMFDQLRESWLGYNCSFCQANLTCETCILVGEEGCCNGLWKQVCDVLTWGDWIGRAKNVLNYIKEKRDENII